ncbi:hypothetical protein PHPALM_36496 [Phytophthora palmivora]|uniref:Integrase catalytic domain-containing protein n=1 Tax=Phytophthora palmivora TaxID=4796 RepID=A0A2P4WZT1_9STRA|nr:hypothetical protein PHPALM_36496 [Phytophthora palmivora]
MLQSQQVNPVAYRPQMVGLVERFHRTRKDCVATYMNEDEQRVWDVWLDFAIYAYNLGQHTTVGLSPNELVMGRRLRSPNKLLRATIVTAAGEMSIYHRRLLEAHEIAERARVREQEYQVKYYNRKTKQKRTLKPGDRVWMYKSPRGSKASNLVHQWIDPVRGVEPAGYTARVSFLVTYYYPTALLKRIAADLTPQLEHEKAYEKAASAVRSTATPVNTAISKRGKKMKSGRNRINQLQSEVLVELRRRRRRNRASLSTNNNRPSVWNCSHWMTNDEYDKLFESDRVMEDAMGEESI